jgi:hypothetical protein
MIEHIIIAVIIAALVWWVLAKLVGPLLAESGAPFLTTLGNALVAGAALLGLAAGVLWFFGGPSIFGGH